MSMSRKLSGLVLAATLLASAAVVARPAGALAQEPAWTGNVNVFLGTKGMNDNDEWEPVDTQTTAGFEVDFRPKAWPVNLVVGLRGSTAEDELDDPFFGTLEAEGEIRELAGGVRKIWDPAGSPIRPYIGGGLAIARAEFTSTQVSTGIQGSDSDTGFGIWFGGGLYFTIGEHFNIGADARYSTADVTLFDLDVDAGGAQIGLLLGYHW
jgi:opacity protein-like surface antigen